MASKVVKSHGPLACTVEISENEVDAGRELSVTAQVSCPHGCDLSGQRVSIRNQDGVEVASSELTTADGENFVTSPCILRTPRTVGAHSYRAVIVAAEANGVPHEETSTAFSFTTLAHTAHMNAWGMPSAIAAGERFKFNVGIKCSAGCFLSGRTLAVFDHEGAQVGAALLREDVWPGSSALYFAEVEALAPATTGDYQWQISTPESDEGLPHAAGSCSVTIKFVQPPDHEVTVEVIDSATRIPIKGIHVRCFPYQASTDACGIAKVKVANGRYVLYVSGFNYMPHEAIIDVADDVSTRVELTVEPEESEDYR